MMNELATRTSKVIRLDSKLGCSGSEGAGYGVVRDIIKTKGSNVKEDPDEP